MPYDVSGVLEVTWDDAPAHWFPVLHLDVFGLGGCEVSNCLFALAKAPRVDARYAERGLPQDSSALVASLYREDRAFLERHGESNVGHTHATLQEVEAALAEPDAPGLKGAEWRAVLDTVACLRRTRPVVPAQQWRFVVWGNW